VAVQYHPGHFCRLSFTDCAVLVCCAVPLLLVYGGSTNNEGGRHSKLQSPSGTMARGRKLVPPAERKLGSHPSIFCLPISLQAPHATKETELFPQ